VRQFVGDRVRLLKHLEPIRHVLHGVRYMAALILIDEGRKFFDAGCHTGVRISLSVAGLTKKRNAGAATGAGLRLQQRA
jgi:hypothetical protein